MRKKKRFISFDLSTQMLKQYYPGKDHHQAYKDIQKYMKDHGFDHSEWSGYFSKKAMNIMPVLASGLSLRMTWNFN